MTSSLNMQVFRDNVITQPIPFSVQTVATCQPNLALVGTADGKIAVYAIARLPNGHWDMQLATLFSSRHAQPIHTLVPIPQNDLLFAVTHDSVTVHRFPAAQLGSGRSSGSADLLTPLSSIGGMKDVLCCCARRYKGSLMLAVLQRKRVAVYTCRAAEASCPLVLSREAVTLPDGPRCMAWSSKGLLIGCRKEYCMLPVPSPSGMSSVSPTAVNATVEPLYGLGQGGAPFLLSLDPVPEVLVGVDGVFCRALADGSVMGGVPSDGGEDGWFSWVGGSAGAPAAGTSTYAHPYLLAGHARGTATGGGVSTAVMTLEVYLPLATTIPLSSTHEPGSRTGRPRTHCHTIDVPVRHLSHRTLTDLDRSLPTRTTPPADTRPDPVVVIDDKNRAHVLVPIGAAEQARALAAAGHYGLAELLAQLSPNEVPDAFRSVTASLHAATDFARGAFPAAMHRLREAAAHPLLSLYFFGDVFRCDKVRELYTPPTELDAALAKCATVAGAGEKGQAALAALLQYLLGERLQIRSRVASAADEQLLGCVDTTLVKVLALLGRDDAVQDLLADTNWCDSEDATRFLQARERWVALAALWRASDAHGRALAMLATLAVGLTPPAAKEVEMTQHPLPKVLSETLLRLVSSGYVVQEELTPQTALAERVRAAETETALTEPQVFQVVGILTLLSYLRGLSLADAAHRAFLEMYAPWLLTWLPSTTLSLSIFTSPANRGLYRQSLALIQHGLGAGEPRPSTGVPRLAVVTDFQAMILADAGITQNSVRLPKEKEESSLSVATAAGVSGLGAPSKNEESGKESSETAQGASALADIHAGYWQNLALLVFGGSDGDPTPVAERRRQLDAFLLRSPLLDTEAAEEFFEDAEIRTVSSPERAIVYRRCGSHHKAMQMFLQERDSLDEAKAYCAAAQQEGCGDEAYLALFRMLFQKGKEEEERRGRRADSSVWTQEALQLLRTSGGEGRGGGAPAVLAVLPDELPLSDMKEFLLNSLRQNASASHVAAVEAAVLASEASRLACLQAAETSRGVVVTDDEPHSHACAVCRKRLRPDTAFLLFPNNIVAHVGCVEDRSVCPVTGTAFRKGLLPALL